MKWERMEHLLVLKNKYKTHLAIIVYENGKYKATCFDIINDAKNEIREKFVFPTKRNLRELKKLVEGNYYFLESIDKKDNNASTKNNDENKRKINTSQPSYLSKRQPEEMVYWWDM